MTDKTVQAMPEKSDVRKQIEALQKAAFEIVTEGHNGWGNTCLDAARLLAEHDQAIESLRSELDAARAALKEAQGELAARCAFGAADKCAAALSNHTPTKEVK